MLPQLVSAPRLILIAAVTLLSVGCSRTELAYRNADWLLERYASQTVNSAPDQLEAWQPVLQTTLRRHREQELPLVIAYLELAGRIVAETDEPTGAGCLVDGALFLYRRHARLAVELAVPVLANLDADQVSHLAEYTTQRQQDAIERYLDPDPQRRKTARQQRITDRIEKWTGRLNANQQRQIGEALERIPDLSAAWLSYRAKQTDTLLRMLENGAAAEPLRAHLVGWWVHRDGTSAETRKAWQTARQEFIMLLDNLSSTLTDWQRAKLEGRLAALHNDLSPFLSPAQQPASLPALPACDAAPA